MMGMAISSRIFDDFHGSIEAVKAMVNIISK
jgi:hypothetical protein